jgi:hypothetical protein
LQLPQRCLRLLLLFPFFGSCSFLQAAPVAAVAPAAEAAVAAGSAAVASSLGFAASDA